MKIVAQYSWKNGREVIESEFPNELAEIKEAIAHMDDAKAFVKVSKEKTMPGKLLFAPKVMNQMLRQSLEVRGWQASSMTLTAYIEDLGKTYKGGKLEVDGVKNQLGLEIQFGKYAFLPWDILGKLPIFAKHGRIRAGVEVLPMSSLQRMMSSGVGTFEYITLYLSNRGVSNIDIPVLVLGIAPGTLPDTSSSQPPALTEDETELPEDESTADDVEPVDDSLPDTLPRP